MVITEVFHIKEMERQNRSVALGTRRYLVILLCVVIKSWEYQIPYSCMILT